MTRFLDSGQPLRTVIIGIGKMGKNHLRLVNEDEHFQLVGLVDPATNLGLTNAQVRQARVFQDVRQLRQGDFDCAIVAAPTRLHYEIVEQLLPKCPFILLEKPVASSHRESQALGKLAQEVDSRVFVGHVERFNPAISKARQIVEAGFVGQLIHVATTRVGGYPTDVQSCDNVLLDLAVHDLDILRCIMGDLEIVASVCHSTWQPDVFDTADILLRDANGRSAVVHANWVTHTKVRSLRITGTRGVCFVDNILQTCVLSGGNLLEHLSPSQFTFEQLVHAYKYADRVEFGVHKAEPLKVQLQEFRNAMIGKPHALCGLDDGSAAVYLAETAISQSVRGVTNPGSKA